MSPHLILTTPSAGTPTRAGPSICLDTIDHPETTAVAPAKLRVWSAVIRPQTAKLPSCSFRVSGRVKAPPCVGPVKWDYLPGSDGDLATPLVWTRRTNPTMHPAHEKGNPMRQLSTEIEDRKTATVGARTPSVTVSQSRHLSRGPSRDGDSPAVQPTPTHDESTSMLSSAPDLWEEGRVAARSGDHDTAIICLVREAESRTEEGSHGRAAIAFLTAAEQARLRGLAEQRDQLLHRAAAAYTHAAERTGLAPGAAHQAWISAAKCFLQLQQLDGAARCIEQGRRVAQDLHGRAQRVQTAS